jgi:hypothetical protein
MLFAKTTRAIGAFMKHRIPSAPLRPFIGGIVIATAVWGLDAYRYIGLGIPDILRAFRPRPAMGLPGQAAVHGHVGRQRVQGR